MLALLRRYFNGIPESGKIFFSKSRHSCQVIIALCSEELHLEHMEKVIRNTHRFSNRYHYYIHDIIHIATKNEQIHRMMNS